MEAAPRHLHAVDATTGECPRSSHRGVSWDKTRGKWRATAKFRGQQHTLGRFDTEAEAAEVARAWRHERMPSEEALAESRYRSRVENFWRRVQRTDGCWLWLGSLQPNGYGQVSFQGRHTLAHRLAYQLAVGEIPEGLTIDHLCRNRACVNPDHLEPVTRGENVLRGQTITAENAAKTHCKHGHPFDEANTRWVAGGRHRECRACRRAIDRRRRDRQVA